jgi:hypothetical protein
MKPTFRHRRPEENMRPIDKNCNTFVDRRHGAWSFRVFRDHDSRKRTARLGIHLVAGLGSQFRGSIVSNRQSQIANHKSFMPAKSKNQAR